MRFQHVRFPRVHRDPDEPRFQISVGRGWSRLYLGDSFWDLLIGPHRWRWFW